MTPRQRSLSHAQHGTGRVARYSIAKSPQAAQPAGLRTSSEHQHIRSQSARLLGELVFDRAHGDPDYSARTSSALQLLDAAVRCVLFRCPEALLQIQSDPQVGHVPGNHVHEREICTDRLCSLAGIPKNSFRICIQANGADPFPMFELSWATPERGFEPYQGPAATDGFEPMDTQAADLGTFLRSEEVQAMFGRARKTEPFAGAVTLPDGTPAQLTQKGSETWELMLHVRRDFY